MVKSIFAYVSGLPFNDPIHKPVDFSMLSLNPETILKSFMILRDFVGGGALGGVDVRVLAFNLQGRRFKISARELHVVKLVVTCRWLVVYNAESDLIVCTGSSTNKLPL